MNQFPHAVPTPETVSKARSERQQHLLKAALIGVTLRSLIIGAELTGVFLFGSSALLLDALSSLIDVFSSLFLVLFIKLAERPPDEDHPFGHGRFEPLAGLQLGLLLVVVGAGMLIQQSIQITSWEVGHLDSRAWIIPLAAVIILEICYHITQYTARKHHSTALAADAIHYRIDSLTSICAAVALLLAAYIPQWSIFIDHIGAVLIALLMIIIGFIASKDNLNQLLDRIPSSRYFETVRRAAKGVTGVRGTEKIRIQQYGPDAHVDIDIEVDPHLSVEEAHQISQYVRASIQKDWPAVRDVLVHIEPYYPGDH